MPSLVRWHHKGFQATARVPKPVPTLWRYDADWRDSHPDTSASQDLSRAMRLRKIVGGLPLQALSISSPSRSQRGGPPKPRASNSAGAATTERGWSYSASADSDQIGRGTANPHPTTPFKTRKKIGRRGHAGPEDALPMQLRNSIRCFERNRARCTAEGSSRGLYSGLNPHA